MQSRPRKWYWKIQRLASADGATKQIAKQKFTKQKAIEQINVAQRAMNGFGKQIFNLLFFNEIRDIHPREPQRLAFIRRSKIEQTTINRKLTPIFQWLAIQKEYNCRASLTLQWKRQRRHVFASKMAQQGIPSPLFR
jgi:hypothetical protein